MSGNFPVGISLLTPGTPLIPSNQRRIWNFPIPNVSLWSGRSVDRSQDLSVAKILLSVNFLLPVHTGGKIDTHAIVACCIPPTANDGIPVPCCISLPHCCVMVLPVLMMLRLSCSTMWIKAWLLQIWAARISFTQWQPAKWRKCFHNANRIFGNFRKQ